jgi:hypothetical protein
MRLSNFFIESIGLYLPESYSTESAVADGYLDADTREKNGWTDVVSHQLGRVTVL